MIDTLLILGEITRWFLDNVNKWLLPLDHLKMRIRSRVKSNPMTASLTFWGGGAVKPDHKLGHLKRKKMRTFGLRQGVVQLRG